MEAQRTQSLLSVSPWSRSVLRTAMTFDIVVLPGDGIGPEVTAEAVKVLRAVGERYGHSLALDEHLVGGASIDTQGVPVSEETMAACAAADAVLLGAVGGPRWGDPSAPV